MTDLVKTVRRTILDYAMLSPGDTCVAAVSGGTDSMALLHLLFSLREELGFSLRAAHYNHNLRGEESDGDEAFVRTACEKLGVSLTVGSGDVAAEAAARHSGLEETARSLRYAFFREVSDSLGGAKVATAHQADDNLETVLFRLARGTGLDGLGGIPPVREIFIRPLLFVSRAELTAFLAERGLTAREDSTNASDDYARNLLRHRAVPALLAVNEGAVRSSAVTARLVREDAAFLDRAAEDWLRTHPALTASDLAEAPFSIASRAIRKLAGRELSYDHVMSVLSLCRSSDPSARLDLPGLTVRREYDRLLFGAESAEVPEPAVLEPGREIRYGDYAISCSDGGIFPGVHKSFTDFLFKKESICGNITVRPRKTGDLIRLSEQGGHQSLKKLMIYRHIPKAQRALVPVLSDEAGVIAVYGLGSDLRTRAQEGDHVIRVTVRERTK